MHSTLATAVLLSACGGDSGDGPLILRDTLPGGIPRVLSQVPVDAGRWMLAHERSIQPSVGEPGELIEPQDLALAADGTLYVADTKPARILVFDQNGAFQRTLGREGSGPGEFRSAWVAVRGDTLVVQDPGQSRGTIFNTRDGSVLSIRTTTCCWWFPIGIDGKSRAVARMLLPPDSIFGPRQGYLRFSLDGARIDTAWLPEPREPSGLKQWSLGEGFLRPVPLRPRGVHAIDPTGGFITGWSNRYQLVVTESGRDTVMVFGRAHTPVAVRAAEKSAIVNEIIARMDFATLGIDETVVRQAYDPSAIPDQRPAFEAVWVDGAGRRWVRLSSADTGRVVFDLFDPEGVWLDQLSLPRMDWPVDWPTEGWRPVSFASDRVAVLVESVDGRPIVRIYRIVRGQADSTAHRTGRVGP